MPYYKIYAGLSGGFGGAHYQYTDEFDDIEEASVASWEYACEIYENYAELHGLRDISDIMEEENCSEDEAWEYYQEDRESWIEYYVKETDNLNDEEDE